MSGFGRAVADEYREMKRKIERRPVNTSDAAQDGGIDREVREQVVADLDGLVKRHDP